jgi:hypothetical protein
MRFFLAALAHLPLAVQGIDLHDCYLSVLWYSWEHCSFRFTDNLLLLYKQIFC